MGSSLLIADSNDAVLTLHAQFLTDQGYRVHIVTDGLACLEHLRRYGTDVLILDCSLLWGGADGLLAQLREGNDLPAVPVVLTSTSDFVEEDYRPPVTTRLMKPFRMTALADAVALAQTRGTPCEIR